MSSGCKQNFQLISKRVIPRKHEEGVRTDWQERTNMTGRVRVTAAHGSVPQ